MNKVDIKKQFFTETAHIVRNAYSERCRYNIHGHSYKWEICLTGEVDNTDGMVLDFKKMEGIKHFIDKFDHATVLWSKEQNEILRFFKNNFKRVIVMEKNCTAENMAKLLHQFVSQWLNNIDKVLEIKYIQVWETAKACAGTNNSDGNDTIVYMHIEE